MTTEAIPTKKCTKCGAELLKTTEYFNKQGKYLASWCKQCTRNNNKEYRKINKMCSNKEYQKNYKKSERYKEWMSEYIKSDKYKNSRKEYKKSEKFKNLTLKVNTRQRLRRQLGQEPPKELLEAKIIHLKIKRLCATSEN